MVELGVSPNQFERLKPRTNARSQAEAAIEGLRARGGVFVEAVRATRMPMVLTDPNLLGNPIVFANPSFLKLSGYSMEEVLGQQPHFMNGPDTDPSNASPFAEMLRSEQDDIIETVQYRKDGSPFVATVLLSAYKDEDGRTLNHFMSWLDVTRRVNAEAEVAALKTAQTALHEREAQIRSLFDAIDEAVMVIEPAPAREGLRDWRYVGMNPQAQIMFGVPDLTGQTVRDNFPDEDEGWYDIYQHVFETGEPRRIEREASSQGMVLEMFVTQVASRSGAPNLMVVMRDVTERRRATDALRQSQKRQAFLLSLSDALRPVSSPEEIKRIAASLLGKHIGVNRLFYADAEGDYWHVTKGFEQNVEPLPNTPFEMSAYGDWIIESFRGGKHFVVSDITGDPRFDAAERAAHQALEIGAEVAVPLAKNGELLAMLVAHNHTPRLWSDFEIELIEETAERTWAAVERARSEAALRDSEERQAFLLALSDALRPLSTPFDIAKVATARLCEKLEVSRVLHAEVAGECLNVEQDHTRGVPSIVGKHSLAAFGQEFLATYKPGAVIRVDDVEQDPSLTEKARAELRERQVAAFADAVLFEEDGEVTLLAVQSAEPRIWSPSEEALIGEVGERMRSVIKRAGAETARRESEERLRRFGEASQDILWIRDAEALQWVYLTPAFETIYGVSCEEALKEDNFRSWLDLIVPEDRERAVQEIERVRGGEHVTFEYRIKRPSDGSVRWLRNTDFPILDGSGTVAMIGGIGHDVTELREIEERRRTSEERFGLIVANARDYAIFTTDPDGRIDQWYEGAAQVFGWTPDEVIGELAEITFTPEDRVEGEPAKERETAARDGRAPNVRWHMRKDGKRIFIDGIASPLRDHNGELTGFLKIGQDVTERRRAEERQSTLLAELQHRVRNIMAMIRSIARRTGETTESVEDYVQHLEGRLSAMARTQALLTRDVNAAVDLQNLILDELDMQAAQPEQYAITGPDVALPPKAAEVLGLALHELATNAVKYGALKEKSGFVDVRWAFLEGERSPQLSFIWSEFGVRIDSQPSRVGFGTELLTQRVPYELHGTGTLEFRPTGLVATLEFPLADLPSILQTDEGTQAIA